MDIISRMLGKLDLQVEAVNLGDEIPLTIEEGEELPPVISKVDHQNLQNEINKKQKAIKAKEYNLDNGALYDQKDMDEMRKKLEDDHKHLLELEKERNEMRIAMDARKKLEDERKSKMPHLISRRGSIAADAMVRQKIKERTDALQKIIDSNNSRFIK